MNKQLLMLCLAWPVVALALQNRSDDQACALERTPLTRCGEFAEYMKEDRILNANYKALMKSLGKRDAATLKGTQLQWLDWRVEKCDDVDEQTHCDNGICAGVAHDDCIVSLTRQRADELKRFANDPAAAVAAKFAFSKELK
jgi:uncharacterized protein YecT (DUF1311 family)